MSHTSTSLKYTQGSCSLICGPRPIIQRGLYSWGHGLGTWDVFSSMTLYQIYIHLYVTLYVAVRPVGGPLWDQTINFHGSLPSFLPTRSKIISLSWIHSYKFLMISLSYSPAPGGPTVQQGKTPTPVHTSPKNATCSCFQGRSFWDVGTEVPSLPLQENIMFTSCSVLGWSTHLVADENLTPVAPLWSVVASGVWSWTNFLLLFALDHHRFFDTSTV